MPAAKNIAAISRNQVRKLTGTHYVNPGHFKSLEEARSPSGEFIAALTCAGVFGAASEVYTALALLERIEQGTVRIEDALAWADDRWTTTQAGGNPKSVEPGLTQAKLLAPHFEQLARTWFKQSPAPRAAA